VELWFDSRQKRDNFSSRKRPEKFHSQPNLLLKGYRVLCPGYIGLMNLRLQYIKIWDSGPRRGSVADRLLRLRVLILLRGMDVCLLGVLCVVCLLGVLCVVCLLGVLCVVCCVSVGSVVCCAG
jgi:hypothetical protein